MPDSSIPKATKYLNPSRQVRIIGKTRGLTEKESESITPELKPWISVRKQEDGSSEKCTVVVENQSSSRTDAYELDCFYGEGEDVEEIYLKEIKPLLSAVFDGQNASAIAIGARGSGKTFNALGSQGNPGLVVMTMTEILSKAEELEKSVSISFYELVNDHVYDLLNHKRPEVQVLEDAQGKINLRGLTQVNVTSISEFCDMYFGQSNLQSTPKAPTSELRHQMGLMVYISSKGNMAKTKKANKINFVDLIGYEDPRKIYRDGIKPVESNRANKSLYALLNVVSAINSNVARVPYRESKLTRILQDSIGGTNHVLLLACLNPLYCQDSVSLINLVARSSRSTKEVLIDSTNRQSSAKSKVLSSVKSGKNTPTSLSLKKPINCNQLHSARHIKRRKLFDKERKVELNESKHEVEEFSTQKSSVDSDLPLVVAPFALNEDLDQSISGGMEVRSTIDVNDEGITSQSMLDEPIVEDGCQPNDSCEEATLVFNSDSNSINENPSPPLSQRIKEISDNLKSLLASTPLTIEMPQNNIQSHEIASYNDVLEPETPSLESNNAYCSPKATYNILKNCTPRATFSNRSSKMKDTLVQDYLNFVNSANKEELKSLKGIGEKRATRIIELRNESPEPFKNLDDLKAIGLSSNQIKTMMKNVAGELFK